MKGKGTYILTLLLALILTGVAYAQQTPQKIILNHSDEFEVVFENGRYVTYVNGRVDFQTETGHIYCDSAVFLRGVFANLRGRVLVDDIAYLLRADSVYYDLATEEATALGRHVELWSFADSLYGVGVHAFYNRKTGNFDMEQRPTIYLGYPDSTRMVEIIADYVNFRSENRRAEALGNVIINSEDLEARSECAVMNTADNILDLYTKPVAKRGLSTITGEFISVYFTDGLLRKIDVMDSANGEFTEPIDSARTDFDRSRLRGSRMIMSFVGGELHEVECYGQAYSWYYPSMRGSREYHENSVSGDTIRFGVRQEQLQQVTVIGGAQGSYVTGKIGPPPEPTAAMDSLLNPPATEDSMASFASMGNTRLDTISYQAHYIQYSLVDSMIMLRQRCEVQSGTMSLGAYEVELNTASREVTALSAEVNPDSADIDYYNLAERLQPATIPVVLKDGNEELLGDYLQYSIDTQKGRIVQTKSAFEKGYYYGNKLLRERKDVYYIEDGYYTTCDADEPHYHFYSTNMKLMENNKLIARPVVFYLGRLPLMAIPYYVFPLKKGRHSGLLPFSFGRFERGQRYVDNVGYFWAPSDYWDWKGWFNYHEDARTIYVGNEVAFAKRYVLNGKAHFEYQRTTSYNRSFAREESSGSWKINGNYSHNVSPSFRIGSTWNYLSRSDYNRQSSDIEEILNRQLTSQANFSKQFGKNTSLSGNVSHVMNLDNGSREDVMPQLDLRLPTVYPFGSGSRNADGKFEQHWWNDFTFTYGPSLRNYSRRTLVDSFFTVGVDTNVTVIDSLTGESDTTYATLVDTVSYRTRRHYATITHNPRINLPRVRLGNYLTASPTFSYNETWYKIWETDQSLAAGIDAGTTYRTYSYSATVTASTALYGTVYPHMFGLSGLRHVLEPSVAYGWSPELNRHPGVRGFVGSGAASRKSSSLTFGLKNQFQAKLGSEGAERAVDLLNLQSFFGYDFERDFRPLSNLRTNFSTSTLPGITLGGDLIHSFYDPRDAASDKTRMLNPWLLSFNLTASFTIHGQTFFFTDAQGLPTGADSAQQLAGRRQAPQGGNRRGWNMSVSYTYNESGHHTDFFSKRHFVHLNLSFALTPVTSVNYSQDYNFVEGKTLLSSINITRALHCWSGSIYWVPIGPNRGFGFRLFVTDLPAVKVDQGYGSFLGSDLLNRGGF